MHKREFNKQIKKHFKEDERIKDREKALGNSLYSFESEKLHKTNYRSYSTNNNKLYNRNKMRASGKYGKSSNHQPEKPTNKAMPSNPKMEYSADFNASAKLVKSDYSEPQNKQMPVIGGRSKSLNTKQDYKRKFVSHYGTQKKADLGGQRGSKKNWPLNSSGSIAEKFSKQSAGSQPFSMGKFKVSGFLSPKNNSVQTDKMMNEKFSIGSNQHVKMNFVKKKNVEKMQGHTMSHFRKNNYKTSSSNLSVQMKFVNVNGLENGKEKIGQDSVLINKFKVENEIFYVFAVLDGHGKHGHHLSQYVKKNMIPAIKYFLKKQFAAKKVNIKDVLKNSCQYLNMKIKKISNKFTKKWGAHSDLGHSGMDLGADSTAFDATLSGTTCSLVLLYNNKLYSLSLGDSKGVIGVLPQNSTFRLMPYIISTEHKASSKSEQTRILSSGGFLHPLISKEGQEVGPIRIWNSSHKYPGLMVSRSFGDLVGKDCGVSGEPDIIEMELKQSHRCLVLATDGFWDMHSNLEALSGFYSKEKGRMVDIEKMLVDITKRTLSRWEKNFGQVHRDDISIVLVYFDFH